MAEKTTINLTPRLSNVPTLVGYGVSKIVMSKITSPVVGDATLKSGLLKLGIGLALDKGTSGMKGTAGKVADMAVAGVVLDATEDLAIGVIDMITKQGVNLPIIGAPTSGGETSLQIV